MTTSMLMEMNLGENGGPKLVVNGGGGGRRRKSKGSELTQKKNKQPQRGMGVAQLEQQILLQEGLKEMTEVPSLHHLPISSFNSSSPPFTTSYTAVANGAVLFRPPTHPTSFQGIGIHGQNVYATDHHHHHFMDPSVIGSSNVGFKFENSKELSSIPNYVKCASDGCGICHKKKRINGGINTCSANQLRSFCVNNTVGKMIDAGRNRRCAGQVTEVMSVHRNGGIALTEYEFFPGKGGGGGGGGGPGGEDEFMRIGTGTGRTTSSSTWCGNGGGTSVGGMTGLRGGEGSCVTAITGSEEASVSSLDLSLKLSY